MGFAEASKSNPKESHLFLWFVLHFLLPKDIANLIFYLALLHIKPPSVYPLLMSFKNYPPTPRRKQDQNLAVGIVKRPSSIVIDRQGNFIISNENSVLVISPEGTHLQSFTIGGLDPSGLACDFVGNIYVCSTNDKSIQVFTDRYEHSKQISLRAEPVGITFSNTGRIIITTTSNTVQILSNTGGFISSFGAKGNFPGNLQTPIGVACSPEDNILIVDSGNNRVQIFSKSGSFIKLVDTALGRPLQIVMDRTGAFAVSDQNGGRIVFFDKSGVMTTTLQLASPNCLAIDRQGNLVCSQNSASGIWLIKGS